MKQELTVPKRNRFTQAEVNEITSAMDAEGINNFRDYVMHVTRTRTLERDADYRWKKALRYSYSNLFTTYSLIKNGIDVEHNMDIFVEEAGALCQELK